MDLMPSKLSRQNSKNIKTDNLDKENVHPNAMISDHLNIKKD